MSYKCIMRVAFFTRTISVIRTYRHSFYFRFAVLPSLFITSIVYYVHSLIIMRLSSRLHRFNTWPLYPFLPSLLIFLSFPFYSTFCRYSVFASLLCVSSFKSLLRYAQLPRSLFLFIIHYLIMAGFNTRLHNTQLAALSLFSLPKRPSSYVVSRP